MSVCGEAVVLVELVDEASQIGAAEPAIELTKRGTGKQVPHGAVAIEIDTAHERRKWRRAGARKVKANIEVPQLYYCGHVHDVSVVGDEGARRLMPMVEIQPRGRSSVWVSGSAAWCPNVARPPVRSDRLKMMREALVGTQQQTLIHLVAAGLPYLNRTVGAEGARIALLIAYAALYHRAPHTVEVVEVKSAAPHSSMNEVAENEICAEHEVRRKLALNAHIDVLRGPTRCVGGKQDVQWAGYLF